MPWCNVQLPTICKPGYKAIAALLQQLILDSLKPAASVYLAALLGVVHSLEGIAQYTDAHHLD